jgi:hypothetical protein
MELSLTVNLTVQQVLHIHLTEADGSTIQLVPAHTMSNDKVPVQAEAVDQLIVKARAEIEQRTYHMGQKPTLGKDYDDRLTVRLGIAPTTAYYYLGLPEHQGGIRHRRFGKKYHVTERAIRKWEGDLDQQE